MRTLQRLSLSVQPDRLLGTLSVVGFLFFLGGESAQAAPPTILSVVPANLATGVAPNAPVVFTFSTAMNTDATYPLFTDSSNPDFPLFTQQTWNSAGTQLTSTPVVPFPSPNKTINWNLNGFSEGFEPLDGVTSGSFTTGGSGSGAGSGTNRITLFDVGKGWYYDQTSSGSPFLDSQNPYGFYSSTTLSSNQTATSITVTLPTGSAKALTQNPVKPESFFAFDSSTDLASFDLQYPSGAYSFKVQSATSNQLATVNLPASLVQPSAPHVSNFTAAQSVDPSQDFVLTWDGFAGGTAADFIVLQIGTNFVTADPGLPAALPGTAVSALIPANTLTASHFFDDCELTFYRLISTTNASFGTLAYRASSTRFFLTTTAGSSGGGPLVLSNPTLGTDRILHFQITAAANQSVTVEYSTSLLAGSWITLTTAQSPDGHLTITDPASPGSPTRFYRAR